MIATRHLDKDVLRVALEYVYETEENRKERLRLLQKNTDYILRRLLEETRFLSRLEPLLEPLEELNRGLKRFNLKVPVEAYTGGKDECYEGEATANSSQSDGTGRMDISDTSSVLLREIEKGKEIANLARVEQAFDETEISLSNPYEDVLAYQKLIDSDPYTTHFNPDNSLTSRILRVRVKSRNEARSEAWGFESLSLGSFMLRFLMLGRPAGNANDIYGKANFVNWLLAKYLRFNVRTLLFLGFDDVWREAILDFYPQYYFPDNTIIGRADDYEAPVGATSWGVDSTISILIPGSLNLLGGFLKLSVTIRNDSGTCSKRVPILQQKDKKGVYILNNKWLYKMGYAGLKTTTDEYGNPLKDGSGPGELWHDDNVILYIDRDTGKITKYCVPEMDIVINVPSSREGLVESIHNNYAAWAQTVNGITRIDIVFPDLEPINPFNQHGQIANKHKTKWKPVKYRTPSGGWGFSPLPCGESGKFFPILDLLLSVMGAYEAEIAHIDYLRDKNKQTSSESGSSAQAFEIKTIMNLLKGREMVAKREINTISWLQTADLIKNVIIKREFDTLLSQKDKPTSERIGWLSLFGAFSTEWNSEGQSKRIFLVRFPNILLLASPAHPWFGEYRSYAPLFILPGGKITEQPQEIPTTQWNHTKDSLAIYDPLGSIVTGKPLIVIPVFKPADQQDPNQEVKITQETAIPSLFIWRDYKSRANAPVEDRMNLLYSNTDKLLVYYYDGNKNKWLPYVEKGRNTNIYNLNDYTPAGIGEIVKFLQIMSRTFTITTSHGRASREPDRFKSPSGFCEQLAGRFMTNPFETFKLFEALGGKEALNTLRKTYPIVPSTNAQFEGLFINKQDIKDNINEFSKAQSVLDDTTKTEEEKQRARAIKQNAEKFLDKYSEAITFMRYNPAIFWIPADMDKFIFLLSIVGAERDPRSLRYLPIKSEGGLTIICGKASFAGSEIKLLDELGTPVYEHEGKLLPFTDPQGTPLKFSELNKIQLNNVKAISLRSDLNPYHVKHTFGGRIKGVPRVTWPESSHTFNQWYIMTAKYEKLETGHNAPTAVYSCYKLIQKPTKSNQWVMEQARTHKNTIIKFATATPVNVLKKRETIPDRATYSIIDILYTLYLLCEATNADSELKVTNRFRGSKKNPNSIYANILKDYMDKLATNGFNKENIHSATIQAYHEALLHLRDRLEREQSTEFQGYLIYQMIKQGTTAKKIDEIFKIKPEHPPNNTARQIWKAQLFNIIAKKVSSVSNAIKQYQREGWGKHKQKAAQIVNEIKGMNGYDFIQSMYGPALVAMLTYKGNLNTDEVAKILNIPKADVVWQLMIWNQQCINGKIDEKQQEEIFISALDQICQAGSKQFFHKHALAGKKIGL